MKKFWNWKNRTVTNEETQEQIQERTLFLNGTIAEESWFDDDVTPQLFKDELMSGSGNITVWINSPGGDCVAAAQIYNMLMDYHGDVTVKIDGIAASAASVIAMAGTKVLMSPTALMMIHNPLTVAIGDSEEMQKAIDMLSEVKESIINAYEIKPGLPLPAFIHGGGQEGNFRSGTENVPGICGFGAAVAATDAAADIAKMARLRDLAREILPEVPGLVLIGAQEAPHIVNLSLPGVRSQGIINCLQSEGIFVSAGSACSKGHRSHVLEAMKLAPAVIDGSVRVSFSTENEEQDVYALREALIKAKQTLKG